MHNFLTFNLLRSAKQDINIKHLVHYEEGSQIEFQ